MNQLFSGVYRTKENLATENLVPGVRVYDEKLMKIGDREYRSWDPYRSKLAAAVMNGLKEFPYGKNTNVLYLGASAGTTPSHLSDICSNGTIYCIEFSKRMMRNLFMLCETRRNMVPILGDARYPDKYAHNISSIDVVYQDVAQPNQAEIMLANAEKFRPRHAMLAIKSRSISAVKSPKQIFREELDKLGTRFDVLQTIDLRPYDKDHLLVNMRMRK